MIINLLGYVFFGYVILLSTNIVLIFADSLIWRLYKIIEPPMRNKEDEEAIEAIKSTLDVFKYDVVELLTLANLWENFTGILTSIALVFKWDWYYETTSFINHIGFIKEFDLEGYDSQRDRLAMKRYYDKLCVEVIGYKVNYPKTTKVIAKVVRIPDVDTVKC